MSGSNLADASLILLTKCHTRGSHYLYFYVFITAVKLSEKSYIIPHHWHRKPGSRNSSIKYASKELMYLSCPVSLFKRYTDNNHQMCFCYNVPRSWPAALFSHCIGQFFRCTLSLSLPPLSLELNLMFQINLNIVLITRPGCGYQCKHSARQKAI